MSTHVKPLVTDIFVKGAVQGWGICTHSTIPNVMMAFVLIKILNLSGLLTLLGDVCGPIMGIFGLPGESIAVLLGAWMSMGGGVGVAVALFDSGGITGAEMGAMIPAIYLMGSQIQYMGRCLGVIGIQGTDLLKIMAVPPIVAIISLWVMKIIVFAA